MQETHFWKALLASFSVRHWQLERVCFLVFLSIIYLPARVGSPRRQGLLLKTLPHLTPFALWAAGEGPCFSDLYLKGSPTRNSELGMEDSPHSGSCRGQKAEGRDVRSRVGRGPLCCCPACPPSLVGPLRSPICNLPVGASGCDQFSCQCFACVPPPHPMQSGTEPRWYLLP